MCGLQKTTAQFNVHFDRDRMGSEITYAEVHFKNGPSPVQPKASSEKKTSPTVFQKLPPWLPWVTSGFLLLLSIVLLAVIFFLLWRDPNKMYKRSAQNATTWHCHLKSPNGKEEMSCCLPGWVQNGSSCYYFSQNSDRLNWNDSRRNCTGMGSDLVVINSEVEQDFLKRHAETLVFEVGFWIGLSDQEGQNKWQWVDETLLTKNAEFWRTGEPSNPAERCVVMHTSKTEYATTKRNWNDIKCTEGSPRICEAAPVIFY